MLPDAVIVHECKAKVSEDFHARYVWMENLHKYHISEYIGNPFTYRYRWVHHLTSGIGRA